MDDHVPTDRLAELAAHPDPNAPEWPHIYKCRVCLKLLEMTRHDTQVQRRIKSSRRYQPNHDGNGSAKS